MRIQDFGFNIKSIALPGRSRRDVQIENADSTPTGPAADYDLALSDFL
jgi:hypothetical protein